MAAATNGSGGGFYDDVENQKRLCNFLLSKHGPKVREATLMEKRVHYIKGEKLVTFLFEPKKTVKWPSQLPRFESRQHTIGCCRELVRNGFLLPSEKRGKGELGVARNREFDEAGYYTWIYEGDKTMSHLMTTGLIIGFLCCVCFPIWPTFLRVFVWYLSVTLLLFIFGLITIRGLAFLFVWIVGYEFWFLPNLFDETLGFVDSFKPIWSLEPTKPGQLPYRLGVGVAFFAFCYWAVTQPSEFDGFVAAQGDFLKDLYAGKLLPEKSEQEKANIDKPRAHMKSLDELLRDLDREDEGFVDPLEGMDLDDEGEDADASNNAAASAKKEVNLDEDEEQLDEMLDSLVDEEEDITSDEE